MMEGAIDGLLQGLDPHSTYIPAEKQTIIFSCIGYETHEIEIELKDDEKIFDDVIRKEVNKPTGALIEEDYVNIRAYGRQELFQVLQVHLYQFIQEAVSACRLASQEHKEIDHAKEKLADFVQVPAKEPYDGLIGRLSQCLCSCGQLL